MAGGEKMQTEQIFGYYGNESRQFLNNLQVIAGKKQQFEWDWRVNTLDIEAVRGKFRVQHPHGGVRELTPTVWAHGQIAEKTGIRKEYYDKLVAENTHGKDTDIYAENVNYWMHNYEKVVLVRQFNDEMIAMLSDKYRVIDNYDVAMGVLKAVTEKVNKTGHQIRMAHAYISSKSMSYTVYDETALVTIPGKPEEKYWLGVSVRNSEVGYTAFEAAPLIVRQVCTNGMIRENPFRRRHIGGRGEEGDIWSDRTKIAESELILSQVTDMVNYSLDEEKVQDYLSKLGDLNEIQIDPTGVEVSATVFNITQDEAKSIMGALEKNTAFDFVQSMTAYANNVLKKGNNPERATELQKIAGRAVEDRKIWELLEKGK